MTPRHATGLLLSPVTVSEMPRFAWGFWEITGEFFSAHSPRAGRTPSEENALCSRLVTPLESEARSGGFRIQGHQQGEKALFWKAKSLILQRIAPCKIFSQTRLARLRISGGQKTASIGRTQGKEQGEKALFPKAKSLILQRIVPCKIFAQMILVRRRSSRGPNASPEGRTSGNGQGLIALFRKLKRLNLQQILE
jgi:hypothetical protein